MHASETMSEFATAPREYTTFMTGGPNAHRYWYKVRSVVRIVLNYMVIHACKHLPSLTLKRVAFRALGMKIGRNTTIASGVEMDYFFPELIEIGDNTIIGMGAMILSHEFLHDRWRKGPVRIGSNVLISANCTVLAGIRIGDGARVSAMSMVNRSLPAGVLAGGNPVRILKSPTEMAHKD